MRKYSQFRWRMEIRDEQGVLRDNFYFNTKHEAEDFINRNRGGDLSYRVFDYRKEQKKQRERFEAHLAEVRQRVQQSGGVHAV